MDGLQRQGVNRSLQARLSLRLFFCLVLIGLTAGGFSFLAVYWGDTQLQDNELRHVAEILKTRHFVLDETMAHFNGRHGEMYMHLMDDHPDEPGLPFPLPHETADGFYTVNGADKEWRVYVFTRTPEQRFALAEQTTFRKEEALRVALATSLPLPLLLPALFFVLRHSIARDFIVVNDKARSLDQQQEESPGPVDTTGLPSEILPFVEAINRLLVKVDLHVQRQQRFIADAAHELRTPLAALSLQAERLEATPLSNEARARLSRLKHGIERTGNVLQQLLVLARAQGRPLEKSHLVLSELFRTILEEFMDAAEKKGLDLGVTSAEEVTLLAPVPELETLLRNLLTNALRHTPSGGQIDLHAGREKGRAYICVRDTGPGIPEHERERVFLPFYRAQHLDNGGVGLGLAIVKTVADRLGATVEHSAGPDGRGLSITIRFAAKDTV